MNCPKKILVIDDSDFAHNVYKIMFGFMDVSILSAKGGSEAAEIISQGDDIHLVILDLNMPSMNGLEFLNTLPPKFKEATPIVVVSSEKDEARRQEALRCGAVHFFEKSDINALKRVSKDLLDRSDLGCLQE